MSLTRFASLCDTCGTRSIEYTAFPTCRALDCGNHICPGCQQPGSFKDDDGRQTALCMTCEDEDD